MHPVSFLSSLGLDAGVQFCSLALQRGFIVQEVSIAYEDQSHEEIVGHQKTRKNYCLLFSGAMTIASITSVTITMIQIVCHSKTYATIGVSAARQQQSNESKMRSVFIRIECLAKSKNHCCAARYNSPPGMSFVIN